MHAGRAWRENIYVSLRKRNKLEHGNIKDLIHAHNHLFDKSEQLRHETLQLSFQNEKLREELFNSQEHQSNTLVSDQGSSANSSATLQYTQQLEQKVYKLQEEVTELLRRKSENAQQLIEFNQCLQERDKVLTTTQNQLAEKESELLLAKESIVSKESELQEVEQHNQLLRDEYQALNLIYNSLEEKYKESQEEIQDLIQRWMLLKAKDAERMNDENEAASRKRQELVEKNLKEACLEPRVVQEEDKYLTVSPICFSAALPSKPFLSFEAHEGEVNALTFGTRGRILASGGSDRRIKLWNVTHGQVDQRGILSGSNAGVNAIDFDNEETLVLGASNDFACRAWSAPDLRLRQTLTGHSGKVMAAKFLSESSKAVTGSYDRSLKIWDLRSKACIHTLFPGSICYDLVVSDSNLTTVLSGHFDKTVKFWDIRKETPVTSVSLQGKVTSLCLSKDGLYLLCAVRDDTLRIIDLRENEVIQTLSHDGFHIGADYTRTVFSPDGAYAACGCSSGAVYIWSVSTGLVVKELREHSSCVLAVAWHPNGKTLASCDKSKRIIVWGDF